MATVEDAIELLTDPKLRAGFQAQGPYVVMRGDEIIAALEASGAEDHTAARLLVLEALDQLGGQLKQQMHEGGIRAGQRSTSVFDEFWVPRAKLRP